MHRLFMVALCLAGMSCSAPTKDQSKPESATPAVAPKDDAVEILVQSQEDSLKGSLSARADGLVGSIRIAIHYYSPAVRGRIIWGGLVPFDKVWVAGAHLATSMEFSGEVIVGGKTVPAGKYAFFAIPGKERWTLILNSNWQQHLADEYAEKDDVVRLLVEPEPWATNQERLRYVIEPDGAKEAEIVLYWEKIEVSLPFQIR